MDGDIVASCASLKSDNAQSQARPNADTFGAVLRPTTSGIADGTHQSTKVFANLLQYRPAKEKNKNWLVDFVGLNVV